VSTLRYCRDGLSIATYAGPAEHNSPNTNSRAMVQITTHGGQYVGLTMDHWVDLVCFIRRLDKRGLGILNALELLRGRATGPA
jgi:hypothetical protein